MVNNMLWLTRMTHCVLDLWFDGWDILCRRCNLRCTFCSRNHGLRQLPCAFSSTWLSRTVGSSLRTCIWSSLSWLWGEGGIHYQNKTVLRSCRRKSWSREYHVRYICISIISAAGSYPSNTQAIAFAYMPSPTIDSRWNNERPSVYNSNMIRWWNWSPSNPSFIG